MAITCNCCGDDFNYLADVEAHNGEIWCLDCIDDEEDEAEDDDEVIKRNCQKCHRSVPEKELIEKLEYAKGICRKCAHAYELNIWMPPDHVASACSLCTAR